MKLFAIGDLHLNGKADKPMDVFGSNWDRHREKIFDAWQSLVSPSDCVLVPGDICWAMYLEDAVDDLNSIAELNGTKILIRGNHDYWWASPTRIRAVLPAGMYIVQNDSVDMGAFSVCGSRGWMLPSAANFGKADEKIFNRELIRLEMSLKAARRAPVITMLHYPPVACGRLLRSLFRSIRCSRLCMGIFMRSHAGSALTERWTAYATHYVRPTF